MKTKIMYRVRLSMPLLLVGIVLLFSLVSPVLASGITPHDVIVLVNDARSASDLAPLRENTLLAEAAEQKARDMIKNDYFAHTSPSGVAPWHWIKQAGYGYQAAGENLAINYTDAKKQHEAWMESATHRANILSARYQEIGVAVVSGKIDGKEALVTVEFFGSPLPVVVERSATLPPQTAPVEIRGAETLEPALPTDPVILPAPEVSNEMSVPISVPRPLPDMTLLSFEAQRSIWLALLFLSIVSTPLVFLWRACHILVRYHTKGSVPQSTERQSVTAQVAMVPMVVIPVHPPINIDSIHRELPAT